MNTGILTAEKEKAIKSTHDIPQDLLDDLLPKKSSRSGKIWVAFLLIVIGIGLWAYIQQLRKGLIVTDMRDFTSWGIYISNFVFFVAVSLVGSLISAVLK